jgi:hypothetical protein
MMLLITACKENCELSNIDNVFKALLALDPIQLPCSLEQYNALLLNAVCLSIHSGDKSPSVTSVCAASIDGERIWQCIKSEDDTLLQEVPMFANELFLDGTRLSAIVLQESGERVKAQVIADLVDEDLPDPERDKVYPNSPSSADCMILITQCIRFRLQYDRSEIEEVMSCQQLMDYLYLSEKSKQVWKSQCISGCERTIARKVKNYDDTSYKQLMDYLYKSEKSKQVWKSQCISGCKRTITRKQKNYDDSSHNDVMLKCKNGEVDSVMCSIMYARDHDLSGKPGWKQFKKTVQQEKTAARRVNLKNRVTPLLPMYTIISFIRCKSSSTTTHPYLYCYKKVYIDIITVFTFVLVAFDYLY